ncbi:M50 family metallopeptidase [Chengkuizengella axinellae]|uniref:M50 family metallopeptidase n=1 Tax=Chengkuizengella axinellae TaxID=3064388 RepID=A0ABT9J168_9BACL|nr:M50 family metallopeptidase [Chengkuizengella sp. 2205SS18-9]MDP5275364.1 M50 family metallopeptidase [Chengkuizengella sp. 2205SS18-9]
MRLKIIYMSILTIILMYVPFVGTFLRVTNTMIHETGHALITQFTNGEVTKIELFSNLEGVTFTRYSLWIGGFLSGIGGYVFASMMAFIFIWLWNKGKYKWMIHILLYISLINLIFWVRNLYGVLWLFCFIPFLIYFLMEKSQKFLENVTLILSILLLTTSFFSTVDILVLSLISPSRAGDAAFLNSVTYIPTLVWGILFFFQALCFAYLSIKVLMPKKSKVINKSSIQY